MSTVLSDAEKALRDLGNALNKSVDQLVKEASEAFAEASKYDTQFAEAVAKAASDEALDAKKKKFMEKPGDKAGDAEPDGDEDDMQDGSVAKAAAILDLSKAAHALVGSYFDAAAALEDQSPDSPFAAFSKKVKDYYQTANATIAKHVDAWRAKSAELVNAVAKSDDDKVKGANKVQADQLNKAADLVNDLLTMAKGMTEQVTFPRTEKKLDAPLKLEKSVMIEKCEDWMPIQSTSDLMGAMSRYQKVNIGDQPPVYAHIFNAAKALGQKLPEGWHAPKQGADGDPKGADATARWTDLSEADKAAAMRKGVTIIGPTAGLLAHLRAIGGMPLIERLTEAKSPHADAVSKWLEAGTSLLKSLVADEAESIRVLDIPTFPETLVKADHWATVAATALRETTTDAMDVEHRAMRKELAARFESAADVFKKASQSGDLNKADQAKVEELQAQLDAANGKLKKFTDSLVPLTRRAQEQGVELKKAQDLIKEKDARIAELEREPVPPKGRAGDAKLNKADRGGEDEGGTGDALSFDEKLKKADTLSGAARGNLLIEAAYAARLEDRQ